MGHFNDKARVAAAIARRNRLEELGANKNRLEVFAVRRDTADISWEVRKYGGVVLACGTRTFASVADALADGEAARSSIQQS